MESRWWSDAALRLARFMRLPSAAPVDYAPDHPPRVLFYSSSNVGLGHLTAQLRIAAELARRVPGVTMLLATDARDLSPALRIKGMDVITLPGFEFLSEGDFRERPRRLPMTRNQLLALRENLLLNIAHSFVPDVAMLDTLPHGKRNEMLPALKYLKRRGRWTKTVLCLRDIPAAPGEKFNFTRDPRETERTFALYDRILIRGDRAFFDPATTFRWPERVTDRVEYIGYVLPGAAGPDDPVGAEDAGESTAPPPPGRTIVAGFGGGWRAGSVGGALLDALAIVRAASTEPVRLRLFTGPAAGEEDFAELERRAAESGNVRVERFSPEFHSALRGADLAILQCGFSPFHIIETDIPMLLYTRAYKDAEQELRGERLARHPGIGLIPAEEMNADGLAARITGALAEGRTPRATGYRLNGAERGAEAIRRLLPGTRIHMGRG